jgi:hypothetical protein
MNILEPFRRISDTQASVADLSGLGLTQNDLVSLLARLAAMPQLQTLNLADNKLTSLPADLSSLQRVRTLDLRNNMLDQAVSGSLAVRPSPRSPVPSRGRDMCFAVSAVAARPLPDSAQR